MLDPSHDPTSNRNSRSQKYKRRALLRKLVSVDPKYVGFASTRHHIDRRGWLAVLAGFLTFSTFAIFIAVIGVLIFSAVSIVTSFAASLPPADQLSNIRVDQSTKIYDRYGHLLYEVLAPNSGRRTVVPLNGIPLVMRQATIATEDPTFYSNPGVDPAGIARAVYYTFFKGDITGGSTITQQLVKNNLLTNEVTFDRKIREAIISIEVAQKYSKDQILAAYLNTIPYGNLSYGVEAAAQSYFGKDASQLGLAEASLLAGLPQQPAEYDPCLHVEAALARQKDVLRLMVRNGFIQDSQVDPTAAAMDQYLHSQDFANRCNAKVGTVAPHFVAYVRDELEKIYGADVVNRGGLQVYTSLDPNIQKITEEEAQKQIALLKRQNVTNAAVVVLNPQTGEILAMLGSVNFFDKSIDGEVNVAVRPRQPGSSIKPVNYITAFKKGWNPGTQILDAPSAFPQGQGLPLYTPVNYDGKFHGVVTVRTALDNSLNIPAVKTLYFVGVPQMLDMAQQLGYTTFADPSHYGLALTLGAGEVTLLEHTGAYAIFANYGLRVPPTPFRKIIDGQGHVLLDIEKNPPAGQQIIDPRYAFQITNILTDNTARIPEFGPYSPLHLCVDGSAVCAKAKERPVAAKTGTTNDFRDNWTMGYTPELAVGVWVGNSNNSQMINSTGITGAAPIWHNVLARIYNEIVPYKDIAPHDFPVPPGMTKMLIAGHQEWLLPQQLAYVNMGVFGAGCYFGVGTGGLSITNMRSVTGIAEAGSYVGKNPCGAPADVAGGPVPSNVGGAGNQSPPPPPPEKKKKKP